MKKILVYATLIWAGCVLYAGKIKAQDIHFSQFYENAILRNPALTGIFSGDYKAGVNYRNQWGMISNPFQTMIASVESRVLVNKELHDYVSFGVSASYDHAGSIDFNSMQIYPAINYNKCMEDKHKSYLSVGFAGGYIQRSVDMSKVTLDNQYINGNYSVNNPTGENLGFTSIHHYDVSAGLSFNSSMGKDNSVNYYIGAAAYHVTKPKEAFNENESFIRLTTRYTGSFGIQFPIGSQVGITIHANYQNQQPYQETLVGGLISWHNVDIRSEPTLFALYAGAFYRLNDAVIPTLKLDYKLYSFTISYDVNTSTLTHATYGAGGWEFSVFIRGRLPHKTDNVMCPRFEDLNSAFLPDRQQ